MLYSAIAQILETAKRVQKITPQQSYASPVTSVSGSFINVQDGDKESVVSIQSGSQRITSSLLTARAPKAGTKLVYRMSTFVTVSLIG